MDEDRRERIRYYTFAAFVGVLLLANWLGVFRTIFGLDTAIVVTLLAGYKTFYNSISALLERPRLGGHRVVHRGDRGAFGGTIPGRGGGHVHRAGGRGAGIVRGGPYGGGDRALRGADAAARAAVARWRGGGRGRRRAGGRRFHPGARRRTVAGGRRDCGRQFGDRRKLHHGRTAAQRKIHGG